MSRYRSFFQRFSHHGQGAASKKVAGAYQLAALERPEKTLTGDLTVLAPNQLMVCWHQNRSPNLRRHRQWKTFRSQFCRTEFSALRHTLRLFMSGRHNAVVDLLALLMCHKGESTNADSISTCNFCDRLISRLTGSAGVCWRRIWLRFPNQAP